MRPGRGQSAACHRCAIAATASRLLHAGRCRRQPAFPLRVPPLVPGRHLTGPTPHALHSSTTRAQAWPRDLEATSHPASRLKTTAGFSIPAPPPTLRRRRRVQYLALYVSCACHGGRLVLHCATAANVYAPSRAGQTPSGGAPEGLLHLVRLASAPKPSVPQPDQLVHRDAASFFPPVGKRQPTAPAAPLHQQHGRVA